MSTIALRQRTYLWNKPQPSGNITVYLEGTDEIQPCGFTLIGSDGRRQDVELRRNMAHIKIAPWVPGKQVLQVHDLYINGTKVDSVKPLEIEVLSPFVFWRDFGKETSAGAENRIDFGNAQSIRKHCQLHSPVIKSKLTRFIRTNVFDSTGRILWIWGPVGSGKTHLLHHHVRPALDRHSPSYDWVCADAPTERWHVLSALGAKDKQPHGTYAFVPEDQYLDTQFRNRFTGISPLGSGPKTVPAAAICIDSAYLAQRMPYVVYELMLVTLKPGSVPLPEEFMLIVTDVMSLEKRLGWLREAFPEAYRVFFADHIEESRRQGLIREIAVEPIDLLQMSEYVRRTTGCTRFRNPDANQLLQLTGGNRLLITFVLDSSQNLYRDSGSDQPLIEYSDQRLSELGQLLFERMCRASLLTPEQAKKFADRVQSNGVDWCPVNSVRTTDLDLWTQLGLAVKGQGNRRNEFCIPSAYKQVECRMKG